MRAHARLVVIGLVVLALTVVHTRPASADRPRRVAATAPSPPLVWRAPAGCPDASSLRSRVEQRLERPLDARAHGIEVEVVHGRGRYTARVDLRALTVANDVRTLTSARCGELADAVAVIVARVLGEEAARAAASEPAAAPVAVTTTSTTVAALDDDDDRPSVVAALPLAAAQPPPRRWTLGARVSGVSGIGVIPKVGLGGEVALTLRYDRRLVELAGARWVESASQFYNGAPAKVDVDLDVAIARYGWRPPELPIRAWLGVEVGSMRGSGVELPGQQLEGGRWVAAGAGFGVAWQMTSWARLLGTTEALVAVERVRFTRGDGMVAYAPAPLSARFTCGLEIGWQ